MRLFWCVARGQYHASQRGGVNTPTRRSVRVASAGPVQPAIFATRPLRRWQRALASFPSPPAPFAALLRPRSVPVPVRVPAKFPCRPVLSRSVLSLPLSLSLWPSCPSPPPVPSGPSQSTTATPSAGRGLPPAVGGSEEARQSPCPRLISRARHSRGPAGRPGSADSRRDMNA